MKQFDDYIARLSEIEKDMGFFEPNTREVLTDASRPHLDLETVLDITHRAGRLIDIYTANLQKDKAFYSALATLSFPTWKSLSDIQASPEKVRALADKLYLGHLGRDNLALLRFGDLTRSIAHDIVTRYMNDNVPFFIIFSDSHFNTLVVNHADETGIKNLAERFLSMTEKVTLTSSIRDTGTGPGIPKVKEKHDLYARITEPFHERTLSGKVRWILTSIPSAADAACEGITHAKYIDHYLEMCDQPLDYDDTPQRMLIKELNAASTLRFTNNDGTDLTMSLIDHDGTHFTFCNSTNKRNVPGSEAFSAPRRDSVNGVIVAMGRHPLRHDGSKIIRDLHMWFQDGKIIKFKTASETEDAYFQSYLDRDPNNYYVGEIGIGTNPYLKTHVANTLLVEKIGGQFHVALGTCYTMTDYIGDPVHVNNGNHTKNGDHWDIATMLYGRGGKIYLDDRLIMDEGKFIDQKYAILNDGWAAVPENKRPAHRKDLSRIKTKFERKTT